MRKIPIVCDSEWLYLWFVEVDGDDVSEAHVLIAEAQKQVDGNRENEDLEPDEESIWRVDPDGVQGNFTPNRSIKVQVRQDVYTEAGCTTEWVTDCTLTIPVFEL